VAKQQVQIDVQQRISIVAALQEAESRVIEGRVLSEETPALTAETRPALEYRQEAVHAAE
jgi:hypothetical protein